MRRRALLTSGASIFGAGLALGRPGIQRQSGVRSNVEPAETILEGTIHETNVYVIDGTTTGPTALLVGGMHGDEPSGYLAAERILDRGVKSGRLIVLPRANQVAIERGTRHGENGDLNRQFPPGETPTTDLAQAIWQIVERHEPNVVANLHSSKGIYRVHSRSVGQAIFPTVAGNAQSVAKEVVKSLNEEVVPWYMPYHKFRLAGALSGTAPLFTHKVGGDAGTSAYIIEVTKFLLDSQSGARWTERAVLALLDHHDVQLVERES